MKILVTGAAGFIGSHIAEKLADAGHTVTGLDCFSDSYSTALKEINARDLKAQGIEILRLDLAADALDDAVNGIVSVLDHQDQAKGEIFNIGTEEETTTGDGLRATAQWYEEKLYGNAVV